MFKLLFSPDCPLPGYYGENCSKECPKNCWEGFCDTGIGTCLGCVPGYIGPQCDQGRYILVGKLSLM